MDGPQIHGTIEMLVAEEHELWQREAAGEASETDRRRLGEIRASLDQCWDLLRQRRTAASRVPRPERRELAFAGVHGIGHDPRLHLAVVRPTTSERPSSTVNHYAVTSRRAKTVPATAAAKAT